MEEKKVDTPRINPVLDGIEWSINHFAGETVRNGVFQGRTLEELSALNEVGLARWIKGAMDRLDALVDGKIRVRIMEECGAMCASVNRKDVGEAIARRRKYESEEEFLKAEGLTREGNVVYTVYRPQSSNGVRCFCLGKGLPAEETMSRTYCHCSKGFVKTLWEQVLGRPVRVELIHSAISGAQECRFAIYL